MSSKTEQLRAEALALSGGARLERLDRALDALEEAVRADQRAKTWCEARAVVENMLVGIDRVDSIGVALLKRMNEKEDESP